ncbi:Lrp/AsnC family transcriptional regulator [Amaricoccus solimangrovi]|uniref:Lrp/AsnC family transcriptional regulator n=1 Tax=Amaricoccus solimangrovi TaxID=2589815 RepID=A0A501WRM9_9RHOB|nr:Lrp/AsnC family transcriptional regulator [Amaricoccus solimangrovi]TPE52119.1 Lrp/AsnC family transcriptional regulator [Amaricoccus solimangrovi]
MSGLDDLDARLIGLLRADGRMPTATLARHLGVSRGTAQNRIDRLLRRGVLLGFTARVRGDEGGGGVRAIMAIELRAAEARRVVAQLRRMPEVGRVHSTNGRWDMIAELVTPDLAALDAALTAIRAMPAVANSETSILLAELG